MRFACAHTVYLKAVLEAGNKFLKEKIIDFGMCVQFTLNLAFLGCPICFANFGLNLRVTGPGLVVGTCNSAFDYWGTSVAIVFLVEYCFNFFFF